MSTKRIVAKNLRPGTMVMAHLGDRSIPPFMAREVTNEVSEWGKEFVCVKSDALVRYFHPTDTLVIAEV